MLQLTLKGYSGIVSIDGTGLEKTRASEHYIKRIDRKLKGYHLSIAVAENSQIIGLRIRKKYSHDIKDVKYLYKRWIYKPKIVIMDKGYDAEWLHKYFAENGIISIVPTRKNVRTGRHRKKLSRGFPRKIYNKRNRVESVFHALKQKYGSSVSSIKIRTARSEVYCRAILYNIFLFVIQLLGQTHFLQKIYILLVLFNIRTMIIKKGFLGILILFSVIFLLFPVLSVSPENANKILLVDDDIGYPYEIYYQNALNSLNFSYDKWSISNSGNPSPLILNEHKIVIWFTGQDSFSTLQNSDQNALKTFLDYGGGLFLSSKFLGKDIGSSSFYKNYLKISNFDDSPEINVYGIPSDPVSGNIDQFSLFEGSGANDSEGSEMINPINPAQVMLTYSNLPSAIRYSQNYSFIYLAFPFESISTSSNRTLLMNDSLNYLLSNNNQKVYHLDSDGDHYGDSSTWIWANKKPAHYVLDSNDCNDSNVDIRPGAVEVCNGIDDNCNGLIDEEGAENCTNYYLDGDGDGYGTPNPKCLCSPEGNYTALNDGDCDDTDPNVHPGVPDICNGKDDDCDASTPDGSAETPSLNTKQAGVCMGSNQSCINGKWRDYYGNIPNYEYPEVSCDGLDNDCDGSIDEGLLKTFYEDSDGDGYGNIGAQFQNCSAPTGFVENYLDCDDTNPDVHPGAKELCNGIDDDCNASTPDGTDVEILNSNQKGVCKDSLKSCLNGEMIDDYSSITNFQNNETLCDNQDNDCDGSVDEGLRTLYYHDDDRDTYGDFSRPIYLCSNLNHYGYVLDHSDCNDNNPNVHPGAKELCDGIDDDCNASTPDGVDEPSQNNTLQFGVCKGSLKTCSNGTMVDNYTQVSHYESGKETTCDGLDNNCNGLIDENLTNIYYADLDNDSYGDLNNMTRNCTAPPHFVNNYLDCNDLNASIHPGAKELCNGIDDDCNFSTPDGTDEPSQNNTLQLGVCKGSLKTCSNGEMVDNYTQVPHYESGKETTCDELDNNCNGLIDENLTNTFYADLDNDTYGNLSNVKKVCPQDPQPANYVNNSLDCNDNNKSINPNATEICNYIDDNCNGEIDENLSVVYYSDLDGDHFGNLSNPKNVCLANPLINTVNNTLDCNDNNNNINPNATETFNGLDDNCNGLIDEGVIGGNLSTITSTVPSINITIAGSVNLTKSYSGLQEINIFTTNRTLLKFNVNFSKYPLNITNLTIKTSNSSDVNGYTIINHLNLHNLTKAISVDRISGYDQVCVRDSEVSSVSEFSASCNASGEVLLNCPGNNGNYSCIISGNSYIVSGLKHSGVKEYGYCGDNILQGGESCDKTNLNDKTCSDIVGFSSGNLTCQSNCQFNTTQCVPIIYHSSHHNSGGGGSYSSSLTTCSANWTCSGWSSCSPRNTKIRLCIDSCTKAKKNETLACVYDTCHDGRLDGSESDVDCGGSCSPCPNGKHCRTDSDCMNECEPNKKYCYTKQNEAIAPPPQPNNTPNNSTVTKETPTKNNSNLKWILIGVFSFVILISLVFFVHHEKKQGLPTKQGIPIPEDTKKNEIDLLIEKTKELLDHGKTNQAYSEYKKLHNEYEKAPVWEKQAYKSKILDLNIASLEKGNEAK